MALVDLKSGIRAHGFELDTAGQQLIFLNKVQRDICRRHRWSFLMASTQIAAVSGTSTYAVPANAMQLESLRFFTTAFDHVEMDWVGSDELLTLAAYDLSVGSYGYPQRWTDVTPGFVQVYPAPTVTGIFTVRYQRTVVDMVADADVPTIPAAYTDILVDGACELLAKRERQWDAAKSFGAAMASGLEAMKAQYGIRQRQSAMRVARSGSKHYDEGY